MTCERPEMSIPRLHTLSSSASEKTLLVALFEQDLTEPTVIEQGAYILIAAGAFIFIISFLGYCGAIKESRVLLTAYGLFIIIIAVLQVRRESKNRARSEELLSNGSVAYSSDCIAHTAIAYSSIGTVLGRTYFQVACIVVSALNKEKAEHHTQEFFLHTIRKYYTTSDRKDAVTLSWDFMMAEVMSYCSYQAVQPKRHISFRTVHQRCRKVSRAPLVNRTHSWELSDP